MNPIIQKLDFNQYFDRQLETYIRLTKDELGKLPPDFSKLSQMKEDFRDNIFNKLIKMINQNTQVIEPLTGTMMHYWLQEAFQERLTLTAIEYYNKIFKDKNVCFIKT